MTAEPLGRPAGHVFISYVREDADRVDRLEKLLESAGIDVWRDTKQLQPGRSWKQQIKSAIESGTLAFLACFSSNSQQKPVSYQREELLQAIEQIRLRPPFVPWLIPVRFDECDVPEYRLGADQDLTSIERVDLLDGSWEQSGRLISAITTILTSVQVVPVPALAPKRVINVDEQATAPAQESGKPGDRLRRVLLDPLQAIELDILVNETVSKARGELADGALFPTSSNLLNNQVTGMTYIQEQLQNYYTVIEDVCEVLMRGCAYGQAQHEVLWIRVLQRLARVAEERQGGSTVLLNLRKLPLNLAMYSAALGAVYQRKFSTLRAVTTDGMVRVHSGDQPIISEVHPWKAFDGHTEIPNLALDNADRAANGQEILTTSVANRKTPMSDYLSWALQSSFVRLFAVDEDEYKDTFDEVEVYLGFIAEYQSEAVKAGGGYMHGGWHGAFIWRGRRNNSSTDARILNALERQKSSWPPLQAGIFDGDLEAAEAAAVRYARIISDARKRFW